MLDLLESVINSWKSYGINTVSIILYWISSSMVFFFIEKIEKTKYIFICASVCRAGDCSSVYYCKE